MTILDFFTQAAGADGKVVELHRGVRMTLIPDAGASAVCTFSKVDSDRATAHDAATSIAVNAETTVEVDWPYYFVTSATGATRVAVV